MFEFPNLPNWAIGTIAFIVVCIIVLVIYFVWFAPKSTSEKKDDVITDLSTVSDSITRLDADAKKLETAIAAEQSPENKSALQAELATVQAKLIEKDAEKKALVAEASKIASEANQTQQNLVPEIADADIKFTDTAAVADIAQTPGAAADVQASSEKAAEVGAKLEETKVIVDDIKAAVSQAAALPNPVAPAVPVPATQIPVVQMPVLASVSISSSKTSPLQYRDHSLVIQSSVSPPDIIIGVDSIAGRFSNYVKIPTIADKVGNHSLVGIQEIIDAGIAKIKAEFRKQIDKFYVPLMDKSLYPGDYRGVALYIHRIKYVDSDIIEYKPDPLVNPALVKKIPTSDLTYLADAMTAENEIKANINKKLGTIMYYLNGNSVHDSQGKLIETVKYQKSTMRSEPPTVVAGKTYKQYSGDLIGAQMVDGKIQSKTGTVQCAAGDDATDFTANIGPDGIGTFYLRCTNAKTRKQYSLGPFGSGSTGKVMSIPLRNAIEVVDQGGRITRFNNQGGGYKSYTKPTGFRVECPSGSSVAGFDMIADTHLKAIGLRCASR